MSKSTLPVFVLGRFRLSPAQQQTIFVGYIYIYVCSSQKPQKHTGSQSSFLEFMGCLSPNARKKCFPSRHPAALVPDLAASQLLTRGQRLVPIFSNDGADRFLTLCHDFFSWTLNAPVFCIMVATTKYMQCIGSAAKMPFAGAGALHSGSVMLDTD